MKFINLGKVFILFYMVEQSTSAADSYSFKYLKCDVSEESVHPNFKCFARSYSRTMSTLNFYMKFRSPIRKVYVKLKVQVNLTIQKLINNFSIKG